MSVLFVLAQWSGMKWCLIMVLICFSTVTDDVGHLFMCILATCTSFWKNIYWTLCPFLIVLFVFLLIWKILYMFWIQVHCCTYWIFSPCLWLAFLFSRQCISKVKWVKILMWIKSNLSIFLLWLMVFCFIYKVFAYPMILKIPSYNLPLEYGFNFYMWVW